MRGISGHGTWFALVVLTAVTPIRAHADTASWTGLVAINGTELHVVRIGAGTPLLVIHGGPLLDHGYLLPHLRPLADDHELIFYDQRLCGRSAGTVDPGSVTIADFVADIEGLREALGLESLHVLAHSWGGLLAQHHAVAHPDRVRSLILLDPLAPTSEIWQREQAAVAARVTEADMAARQEIMASEAFARRDPDAIRDLLRLSFRPEFADPAQVERLDLYVPDDYARRSEQFAALGPELQSYDLREGLAAVDVPALVVYGERESGSELGGAALVAALPRARMLVLEDCGHFPFVERPDALLAAVRDFLAEAER